MKKSICILLFFLIAFVACNKDEGYINQEESQNLNEADLKSGHKKDKVSVYHYDKDTDSWHVITISPNALIPHLRQGGYLATYVPDDNFEQALIELGYDTEPLDDYVRTVNVETISELNIDNRNINDLTGIEDFTALTGLWCHGNQLTSLDVSHNVALEWLICAENQITNLDVSNNPDLFVLNFYNNQVTNIDVSNNPALIEIECQGNKLTSIDLNGVTALDMLNCVNNQLTHIDVSTNLNLTQLNFSRNKVTTIDLTNNTALTHFRCVKNLLTKLDVSNNTNLIHLGCNGNPNLTCIQVHSIPVSFTYSKDAWADFSLDCNE